MIGALRDYLPLADLGKIVLVCLLVAVVAPSAVALAIVGLDRRARVAESGTGRATALALVAVGVLVVAALIGAGLYALFTD
jgi:hypothetical protein